MHHTNLWSTKVFFMWLKVCIVLAFSVLAFSSTCVFSALAQFTSPARQTRQDGPVCVVSGVPVWIARLLWTCSDFKFSVGDSLELSGIRFIPPKQTRRRQDSFVVSGVAVRNCFETAKATSGYVAKWSLAHRTSWSSRTMLSTKTHETLQNLETVYVWLR